LQTLCIAMARTSGRVVAVAVLCAAGHLLLAQLATFVTPSTPSLTSSRQLRSHVSLAATKEDVAAAKQKAQLLTWAASKLSSDGSPEAGAMQAKAAAAVAEFEALKKGGSAPAAAPVVSAPVAAAPAPAAPVAAAAAPSAVSKADLAAAKQKAQLLTWAANKLASEGSPEAAAMQAKAGAAVAQFEALKKGGSAPAAAPTTPVAAAPVAAAPVAMAPVAAAASAGSKADLAAAKSKAQLLTWAASKLASEGSPEAAAMQAKAGAAVAEFEAMKKASAQPAMR